MSEALPRRFEPVNETWQKKMCNELNIEFSGNVCFLQNCTDQVLGKPSELYKTKGDGNCLFRALSYAVSGSEENHGLLRSIIVSAMKDRKDLSLEGVIRDNKSPEQYLKDSEMEVDGKWGSEVEIFVAAAVLKTDIYTYSKYGENYQWLAFKQTDLLKSDTDTTFPGTSIYMSHTNGNHYDIVLAVRNEKNSCRRSDHGNGSPPSCCTPTQQEIDITHSFDTLPACDQHGSRDILGISLQEDLENFDALGTSMEDLKFVCTSKQPESLVDEDQIITRMDDVEENRSDIFQFDDETDDLSYNTFKRKPEYFQTSTPKKPRLYKFVASMEIPLSPGNSIYNSSFEAECNEQKEVLKKRYTKCSKMLQKAIDTTDDAMMLSRQCHMNCLEHLQESDIREARTKYWTKTYKNRLEWLYDKFDEARRKNDQLQFLIDGGNVACQRCFRALYMINKTGYYKVLTRYRRGSISIGNRRGRDESKITKEAYRWLKEYAYFHSDRMPDTGHQMLPYKTRKNSIYKLYVDEKTENMEYSVSEATFNKVWRTQIPNLKIKQTNSFSKCATCVSIERELERTRNPSRRKKLMGMITVHNGRQMRERRVYYAKREKAKREYKRYMSIIIDGMDQSKTDLPHFCGRLQKGIDPTGMLKTHIQGVLNHGKGTLTTYVDINEYSHDANLIMNILLRTFFDALDKNGRLPRILYIQADNCARENKNKFLLAFCELLVKLNVFHEVNLSFLYVGHTHEDIDAAFSQISEKLRRQDVITLPGILEMLGRGRLVKGMFDIKSWLLPLINEIGGHSKPLHFRFAEDEEGVKMMYRADSSKPWSKCYENMLRDIPTGQPKILIPPNIDQIDTRAIQKNVEKLRFEMTDGQYQWWQRLLSELSEMKQSDEKRQQYAKRDALWLLPLLRNKSYPDEKEDDNMPSHIEGLLDKELDDHIINIKPGKDSTKAESNQRKNKKMESSSKKQVKAKDITDKNGTSKHQGTHLLKNKKVGTSSKDKVNSKRKTEKKGTHKGNNICENKTMASSNKEKVKSNEKEGTAKRNRSQKK